MATRGNKMIKTSEKPIASFGQRCRTLNKAAYAVRQRVVRNGDDLEGWRLSRLMRDVDSDSQLNVAELQYGVWLQSNDQPRPANQEVAN
jgi:hypothetical protein